MADRKISDLTALTTPASGDYVPIVDISEVAAASKNKRITIEELFQGIPVNVGIGTSSPARNLQVTAAPDTVGATNGMEAIINNPGLTAAQINDTTIGLGVSGQAINSAGDFHLRSFWGFSIDKGAGNLSSGAGNSVNADSRTFAIRQYAGGTTWNTQFCVNGSGNVGIGTTSPRFALSIGSTTLVPTATPDTLDLGATYSSTPGANPKLRVYDDGVDPYGFGVSAGQLEYICPSTGSHVFFTAGTERARIDSSGRLLVGTSSSTSTTSAASRGVIRTGGSGTLISASDTVANGGTLDITLSTSGFNSFSGILQVNNVNSATSFQRTQTVFSVIGDVQNSAFAVSTLHTVNGGSAASFTVTYVATGIIRITNTSGVTCSIRACFSGCSS